MKRKNLLMEKKSFRSGTSESAHFRKVAPWLYPAANGFFINARQIMNFRSNRLYQMMIFVALFIILQCTATVTAHAQTRQDIKLSLDRANVISKILSGEQSLPIQEDSREFLAGNMENLSYVIISPSVLIRSGVPVHFADIAIMPPGVHILELQYYDRRPGIPETVMHGNIMVTRTTWHTRYSDVASQVVNLDSGKYYSIKEEILQNGFWDKNTVKFLVSEVTDQQIIESTKSQVKPILASYKDYKASIVTAKENLLEWKKNHSLEGTYFSKNGKTQIKFEGDKFLAYNTASFTATTTFLYGTYLFDDKTIILLTDSTKTTTLAAIRSNPGKEEINIRKDSHALYYKFDGEVLSILGKTDNMHLPFTGDFRKSMEDEAISSPEEVSGNVTASGQVTLDIAWRVEDGTLIVSGKGDIPGNPSWLKAINSFTAAVIGDGITSVGHHAFAMSKITSLVIGKNVKSLGSYALFNCKKLTRVEIQSAEPPEVGSFAFMSTPVKEIKLIVPAGTKAVYEKNKNWKKFGIIEESSE